METLPFSLNVGAIRLLAAVIRRSTQSLRAGVEISKKMYWFSLFLHVALHSVSFEYSFPLHLDETRNPSTILFTLGWNQWPITLPAEIVW